MIHTNKAAVGRRGHQPLKVGDCPWSGLAMQPGRLRLTHLGWGGG